MHTNRQRPDERTKNTALFIKKMKILIHFCFIAESAILLKPC
ncbi:MAG TPA: hypothetical protein DEB17_04640 [Chlorobaculum sp.]|uniref:Uncharacterized protein n=1 Tax=Chlorobaculum tepidum (strain ATCC 49652 / DSM 12025 / NBRC 103806 / TLS) TaxID=194439 RepID=Q8KB44_CHLTE|nr:hypothetical protein CT1950 [Chlorobaculum tepidum TLS]HBU23271.1 hypothetical protein [Chlorobaculum sp.]